MDNNIQVPKTKWWSVVAVMLSLFLLALIISEVKGFRYIGRDVAYSSSITVSGVGEAFAIPDVATFTFSVTAEDVNAAEAQKKAADQTSPVIDALKKEGIDEKDIKTVEYSLQPKYDFVRSAGGFGKQVFVGYEVRQTIQVKVRDADKAGDILGVVGQLGVSNISGLNFTVDDEDAILAEARKLAIEDARAKAKELARDLDVRLGRVVNFSESGGPIYPYAEFGLGGDAQVRSVAVEVPRGENKVTSNVTITYEIR